MKETLFAGLAMAVVGCATAVAEQPDQVGEPAEHGKQPNAPGVVIVVPSEGATLLTGATSSDYPPPVTIVDAEVVNRF